MRLIDWTLRLNREDGAIGVLLIGIIIGIALVIFGIIKFLIPGD
ncbi:MAG TPA: hypothetical protein VE754_02330 [Actinomycetota bacterium]|jgi:hypothetical protein|nr:hypothetical protein [Actinomycetota bacterium]